MARALANEAMVLLKNDGTLPLRSGMTKIAVVGPLADQTRYLLGNYTGTPTHSVSVLEGLKAEFPAAQITFVAGTAFLRDEGSLVPASVLTNAEGQRGLTAEFSSGETFGEKGPVLATRQVGALDLKDGDIPQEAAGKLPLRIEWQGSLEPQETGEFNVGISAEGTFASLMLDGKQIAQEFIMDQPGLHSKVGHIHLEQGRKVSIRVVYSRTKPGPMRAQLIWSKYDP